MSTDFSVAAVQNSETAANYPYNGNYYYGVHKSNGFHESYLYCYSMDRFAFYLNGSTLYFACNDTVYANSVTVYTNLSEEKTTNNSDISFQKNPSGSYYYPYESQNQEITVPLFPDKKSALLYLQTGETSSQLNKPATPTITLSTPSLMAIGVFDPAEPYDVRFTYTDNQSVKNRLVITDPETYEVVYDQTVLTMKLLHTIPEGTLQPSKCYTAAVQVFDIDDNKSNLSESALFYCYTKPVFTISDVPTVCKGASITLPLSYLQPEGETLKSYQFFMCDSNHNILNRSDIFYTDEHMHYSFSGLQNHYTYYFRVIGETTHGYKLDTGYFAVEVDYNVVPTNAVLVLENVYRRGYISIKTNIKSIGYELKNDNYIFEGDTVTLYGDNYIKYNEGFSLDGDFALFVEAKKLPLGTFLRTENGTFTLSIVHVCDLYYCEFKADDYVLYCPLPKAGVSTMEDDYLVTGNGKVLEIVNLNYDDDDFIVFEVKRENSVCSLNAYHKSYALLN